MLISQMLTKFEAYLLTEKCVSLNTIAAYKTDLEQFIDFLQKLHPQEPAAIATEDIRSFLQHLFALGLKTSSVSRKISSLKAFFTYAHSNVEWDDIAEDIEFPKSERTLPKYLSEQEIELLFQAADRDTTYCGVRNKVMIYLLYVSGMRISELTHLRLTDIQIDRGLVIVHGKGDKERIVPLPESMLLLLQHYIALLQVSSINNHGTVLFLFPIFYAGVIKPISRQALWGIMKDLWKKTGISKTISPHQLRHSFATHMLKHGADLRSLQLLLGHEHLSTVQMYTHVEKSYARTIYDKKHPRS